MENNYIDNVVIKLKRQYGKDEYVSYLLTKYSEIQIELGVVKSERDEALFVIDKLKKVDQETKSRFGKLQLAKNMKAEIKSLREQNKKLKIDNGRLLEKVAKLQIQ